MPTPQKVILGGVVFYPEIMRDFLKKSHYFMSYDVATETLTLSANHGGGGVQLFEARNVSPESAPKFAAALGLKQTGPYSWGKYNPILTLHHDGSAHAETLHMEMLRLNIPCRVTKRCTELKLVTQHGSHSPPLWNFDSLLKIVHETAEHNAAELTSTP